MRPRDLHSPLYGQRGEGRGVARIILTIWVACAIAGVAWVAFLAWAIYTLVQDLK